MIHLESHENGMLLAVSSNSTWHRRNDMWRDAIYQFMNQKSPRYPPVSHHSLGHATISSDCSSIISRCENYGSRWAIDN